MYNPVPPLPVRPYYAQHSNSSTASPHYNLHGKINSKKTSDAPTTNIVSSTNTATSAIITNSADSQLSSFDRKQHNNQSTVPPHQDPDNTLFEILGIKIHFDDLLILCILLFLYQENINDEYLFISLILLLLS